MGAIYDKRQRSGLSRRRLLGIGAVALSGGLLERRRALSELLSTPAAGASRLARFRRPLPIPRELSGAQIRIPIRKAKVPILPGRKTSMWTYGGTFPGPTIRRPAGQRTRVTFEHRLPASAGELTVHLHGGHNSSADDGQPGGLTAAQPRALYCDIDAGLSDRQSGNDLLIAPGASRTYDYGLVEDGVPERAAFQWYHDHRLERTAKNVWNGLAGMWIIDDALDASLPLPRGRRDIPLMITDRSFDSHNQLRQPFGSGGSGLNPPTDGIIGRQVLVNGRALPYHRVGARRYRLRLLNASNFQPYNLYLSGGVEMTQIATESGLMPSPIRRRRILLGPGERAEVIADFSSVAGQRVRLRSSRRERTGRRRGADSFRGSLMEFRVGATMPDDTSIPQQLRALPAWVASAPTVPSHRWKISIGGGFRPRWQINGRSFDPSYADATVELDSTVAWELHNASGSTHTFHLHHGDFYMLSRNGRRPPPWERCLKETFFLDPGERAVVAGHFSDHLGRFVVHCHMLDHEDHGLMSQFEVVAA